MPSFLAEWMKRLLSYQSESSVPLRSTDALIKTSNKGKYHHCHRHCFHHLHHPYHHKHHHQPRHHRHPRQHRHQHHYHHHKVSGFLRDPSDALIKRSEEPPSEGGGERSQHQHCHNHHHRYHRHHHHHHCHKTNIFLWESMICFQFGLFISILP